MERKKKIKLYILLISIWFIISLPLPWVIGNPDIPDQQINTIYTIVGIMSVPFVVLGIAWSLKPELTT